MRNLPPALLSLPVLLIACGDDGVSEAHARPFAEDVDLHESVGPRGAELGNEGVRLSVPDNALERPVDIALRTLKQGDERPLPERAELESRAYALTPHGQRFERSVELEFPYRAPEQGRTLRLARLEDEQDERWENVRGASFDGETVSVRLDRFSIYAVVSCQGEPDSDCGLDPADGADAGVAPRADAGGELDAGGRADAAVTRDAAPAPDASSESFAQLSVFPTAADFGEVPVADGQSLPVTLTFENTGTGDATGCSVVPIGPAFVPFNDGCGATLPAGESCTVDVRGEVSAAGTTSGAVVLECDDGLNASANLSVRGTEPALAVTPTSHSFGPVLPSTSEVVTITFRNDGSAPARGCTAPVLTGTDAAFYGIEADSCGSADLLPGTSCTVTVSFAPGSDTSERRATLQRTCEVGGTVTIAPDGLVANRPHYLFIREAENLTGDLGGLAGADAICQTAADAGSLTAGLGLTWRALLSTTTVDARTRIDWQGPVFDVRDLYVVGDPTVWPWNTTSPDPGTPNLLEATENGNSPGSYVWTGSNADGTAAGAAFTCADWTSALGTNDGQAGETGSFPDANWLNSFPNACDDTFFSLICVSDYP